MYQASTGISTIILFAVLLHHPAPVVENPPRDDFYATNCYPANGYNPQANFYMQCQDNSYLFTPPPRVLGGTPPPPPPDPTHVHASNGVYAPAAQ